MAKVEVEDVEETTVEETTEVKTETEEKENATTKETKETEEKTAADENGDIEAEVEEALENTPTETAARGNQQRRRPVIKAEKVNPNDVVTIKKNNLIDQMNDHEGEVWHDLQNSRINKTILTGIISSVERKKIAEDKTAPVAIAIYEGTRVMIPLNELNIVVNNTEGNQENRQARIANNMIGCEIDFTVSEMDPATKAVAGSRRDAMKRKMRDFYFAEEGSEPLLTVGKVVEARVIAVAEKVVLLEIFGVTCYVQTFNLTSAWMADARDKYTVGDTILVRLTEINISGNNVVSINAEGKSVAINDSQKQDHICIPNSKYLGEVTGVKDGVYFVRLMDGANAIAHKYQGSDTKPMPKDTVSFVCTRMDEKYNVAIGIITKTIKRYLK